MTYAEAVEHLYALGPELATSAVGGGAAKGVRRFDLAHMRAICGALGDPQVRVPAVLIAGTNGKGSTAATLASILAAAGYRTGLYTSPHLERVNERIQMARPVLPSEYGVEGLHGADGPLALQPIPDDEFAGLYTQVDAVCEELVERGTLPVRPSFFERLTAVGFLYFAGEEGGSAAEIMVLEVGLGGRLDATNVVEPLLSVITDIALDHQEYLGETIAEIAGEKCGILREGGTVITLPQLSEANLAIGLAATALHARGVNAAEYMPPATRNDDGGVQRHLGEHGSGSQEAARLPENRYKVRLQDEVEPREIEVDSPLPGEHQRRNLALAIASAMVLRHGNWHTSGARPPDGRYLIPNAAIQAGICGTKWAGRLEFVAPNLLLDVAHNPAGAWTLRGALSSLPAEQPRTLIFSCLRDKSLAEMSRILFPLFDSSPGGDPLRRQDHVILAPIANVRAAGVEDLVAAARALGVPAHAAPHVGAALAEARRVTPVGGLIVATGSIYLVGEVRRLVREGHR